MSYYLGNVITRQEIYEMVWQIPISKLATMWSTTPDSIVSVCEKMNIPCPEPEYWTLVEQGLQNDPPPLPKPTADTPTGARVGEPPPVITSKPPKPRVSPTDIIKSSTKLEVPKTLENAHRFVKQTRRALAPHHGADNASSLEFIQTVHPKTVIFSAGTLFLHPRAVTVQRYLSTGLTPSDLFRTDRGDKKRAGEWDFKAGSGDTAGDDDIDITIPSSGALGIAYRQ